MKSPREPDAPQGLPIETGSSIGRYAPGDLNAVAIGLGSNLGDSIEQIEWAIDRIRAAAVPDLARASLFRTEPELLPGAEPQPAYVNTAAIGHTELEPDELLSALKRIEQICGRTRGERWAARQLDLDLLLYGQRIENRPELTLPHPRLHERAFYLVPLAEIAPTRIVPPEGRSVSELLDALCLEASLDPRSTLDRYER